MLDRKKAFFFLFLILGISSCYCPERLKSKKEKALIFGQEIAQGLEITEIE